MPTDSIRRSATFSPCGLFRYTLIRVWDPRAPRCLFGLLNPSIADAFRDDPTNRRGIGFALRWGFGSVVFVNLFAYRSPHPRVMKAQAEPVGPDNDWHIIDQALCADLMVIAWGNDGAHRGRDEEVLEMLSKHQIPLWCLGTTGQGQPNHPLYLRADTKLERWGEVVSG